MSKTQTLTQNEPRFRGRDTSQLQGCGNRNFCKMLTVECGSYAKIFGSLCGLFGFPERSEPADGVRHDHHCGYGAFATYLLKDNGKTAVVIAVTKPDTWSRLLGVLP